MQMCPGQFIGFGRYAAPSTSIAPNMFSLKFSRCPEIWNSRSETMCGVYTRS
jgi:hypothetical protein